MFSHALVHRDYDSREVRIPADCLLQPCMPVSGAGTAGTSGSPVMTIVTTQGQSFGVTETVQQILDQFNGTVPASGGATG